MSTDPTSLKELISSILNELKQITNPRLFAEKLNDLQKFKNVPGVQEEINALTVELQELKELEEIEKFLKIIDYKNNDFPLIDKEKVREETYKSFDESKKVFDQELTQYKKHQQDLLECVNDKSKPINLDSIKSCKLNKKVVNEHTVKSVDTVNTAKKHKYEVEENLKKLLDFYKKNPTEDPKEQEKRLENIETLEKEIKRIGNIHDSAHRDITEIKNLSKNAEKIHEELKDRKELSIEHKQILKENNDFFAEKVKYIENKVHVHNPQNKNIADKMKNNHEVVKSSNFKPSPTPNIRNNNKLFNPDF